LRILLIAPPFASQAVSFYHFPIGLAYVSGALKAAGLDVVCLNPNHSDVPLNEQVSAALKVYDPQIVMSGGLSPNVNVVGDFFREAKAYNSEIVTIAGGGLISSVPEPAMRAVGADIGVIGEGEVTSVELVQALMHGTPLQRVQGIIFRNSLGALEKTEKRPYIMDLDAIPFPDLAGLDVERYLDMQLANNTFSTFPVDTPRAVPLVASRSCPYQCSFCYHPLGNKYRQRSITNIMAEIDTLQADFNINGLTVYDELFVQKNNVDRVAAFCAGMKERGIHWRVSLRVDCITDALLAMLKDSGCFYIGYGIESADNEVLKSMGKNITVEQIEWALKATVEHGIGIQGNFIFGDSREDETTVQRTLDWWQNHLQYQMHLVMVDVYPGTKLYKIALERGLITDEVEYLKKADYRINTTHIDDAAYAALEAQIHAIQKEKLVIPGTVLKAEVLGPDALGRELFSLDVQCPHCGHENHYGKLSHHQFTNYSVQPELHKLGCRACNQRFDVPVVSSLERSLL
jgi:radical SAM superfamily enzyme YgiQ (UPF0313 family)